MEEELKIEFLGPAINAPDGGIAYKALVNGETVSCRISMEALQDINPETRLDDPMSQFEMNQFTLLEIAEEKIRVGDVENGVVWVYTADVA